MVNAVLVKVNQVGTVTEGRQALEAGKRAGFGDDRLGPVRRDGGRRDYAARRGLECRQLKVGSFARSERMAKWNEALRIEESLGPGSFAGLSGLPLARMRR
jgi:enolase